MASLLNQPFPEDVSFMYIPYTPEKADLNSCGLPIKYDASKGKHGRPRAEHGARSRSRS